MKLIIKEDNVLKLNIDCEMIETLSITTDTYN